MGKKHKKAESKTQEKNSEDEISIDLTKMKDFFSGMKNWKIFTSKTAITILLILILMFSAFFIRYYATTFPVTKEYATQNIENNIKQQIAEQVRLENPTLPDAYVLQETNKRYTQVYRENKQGIKQQINMLDSQFKELLQDDNGVNYLTDIDSYLWYSYAKWYDRNGGFYTEVREGEEVFGLRRGREGEPARFQPHSYQIFMLHKTLKVFSPGLDIMKTSSLITPFLMALAMIPAFFVGRKIGGNNVAGFLTGAMVAFMPAILGRTITADNDAQTFIFPLLITWFFLELIEADKLKRKLIFGGLTGLSIALFFISWSGWWFTTGLIFGMLGIIFAYKIIVTAFKKGKPTDYWKNSKHTIYSGIIIIVSLAIFTALVAFATGENDPGDRIVRTLGFPLEPLNFILGFKGAAEGVSVGSGINYPLWPNVLRTVAELNPGSPAQNISSGGGLFFIIIALAGIALLFYQGMKKEKYLIYGVLLAIWMASTYYAGLVGIRFTALFGPAIILGIAVVAGFLSGEKLTAYAKKKNIDIFMLKTAIILVLLLVFVLKPLPSFSQMGAGNYYFLPLNDPISIAKSSIPMYDDTWERAMITIREDDEKGITTSWWDFGHWFQARSERSVTFDGGDQGKRIHWAGKTLLTDDEDEAIDILRVLNCGQEKSYDLLENYSKDRLKATQTHEKITRMDREDAYDEILSIGLTAEQANEILELSHCSDLWPNYYVTSEDMVGKAGVWGHFGGWDFEKAYFYYRLKNIPLPQAMEMARADLGYDDETTKKLYNEAMLLRNENEAANWISTYPNYLTGSAMACANDTDNGVMMCGYNMLIGNQGGMDMVLAGSIINFSNIKNTTFVLQARDPRTGSVVSQNMIIPQAVVHDVAGSLVRTELENSNFPYDLVLFQDGTGTYRTLVTHPLLSRSLFTKLFFMDGKYTENFEKIFDERSFRGQRVIVWKVNF